MLWGKESSRAVKVLVINVGSTSLKFRLFEMENESIEAVGKVERVGSARSPVSYQLGNRHKQEEDIECPDQRSAIGYILSRLTDASTGVLSSLD
jgi:acetate kinase